MDANPAGPSGVVPRGVRPLSGGACVSSDARGVGGYGAGIMSTASTNSPGSANPCWWCREWPSTSPCSTRPPAPGRNVETVRGVVAPVDADGERARLRLGRRGWIGRAPAVDGDLGAAGGYYCDFPTLIEECKS